MIRFIDMHREQFGFEAVCRVVGTTECGFLTSRGCRAAKQRPASARGIWAAKFTCVRIPKGLCDAALFTDVRTRRIVGEPRADHAQQLRNLAGSGFGPLATIDFPHKRAVLVGLTRERFVRDRLWVPGAAAADGRPAPRTALKTAAASARTRRARATRSWPLWKRACSGGWAAPASRPRASGAW